MVSCGRMGMVLRCQSCPGTGCEGAEKMNPDVPDNLDRRQMKDREAIQRFMIALMLEHMVLKWSRKDAEHDVEAMRREMASFPVKALDRCPEDFKEIWRDILFTSIREKVPLKKLPADDLKKLKFQMRRTWINTIFSGLRLLPPC